MIDVSEKEWPSTFNVRLLEVKKQVQKGPGLGPTEGYPQAIEKYVQVWELTNENWTHGSLT